MKDTLTPGDDGNGAGSGETRPNDEARTAALGREQLAEIMRESNAPIAEALAQLAARVEHSNRVGNPGGGGGGGRRAAPPKDEPDEFVAELLADGKTPVTRVAREAAQAVFNEKLVPYFSQKLVADRDAAIQENQRRIDTDYGDGFFDAHVAPLLISRDGKSGALATMPLGDQSLPHVVAATVDGILGRIMANPESRAKMLEGYAKQEQARASARKTLNPPRQLGPGLPRGVKATEVEIPDHIRDSLADMNRSGIKLSEAEVLDALSRGNSADDWEGAFEDEKPAARGKGKGKAA